MPKEKQTPKINLALLDINRGYSKLNASGRDFYFRHFTLEDVLLMEEEYDTAFAHAQKMGIKSEEILIAEAYRRGIWKKSQEEEIKSLEWTSSKLSDSLKKNKDLVQRNALKKSIADKKEKLLKLQEERRKITNYSAESFAENKRIKFLLGICCFVDKNLTEKIGEDRLFEYSLECFKKIGEFNEKNFILDVVYNTSFFELFVLHYRQPHVIFGKSGLELTVFQKSLLVYANSLLNKLKSVSIPDEIANDPAKILEYDEKEAKGKTSQGIDDLKEKALARGGTLKPEDYLT